LNRLEWDRDEYRDLDETYSDFEIYGRSQDQDGEKIYFSQALEISYDKNVDVI